MDDRYEYTDYAPGEVPGHDPTATPSSRRSAPDHVWAAVRAEYLSGMSAPEACRRYGVGLSALRDRAAREGWRRADQPWIPANRLDPEDEGVELENKIDGDLDRVDVRELAYVAFRRMMRAVLRGDAGEALRWRRVRLAMDEENAELERFIEQDAVTCRQIAAWRKANGRPSAPGDGTEDYPDDPDDPDASDGIFPAEPPSLDPAEGVLDAEG